jgi:hypothetical protein
MQDFIESEEFRFVVNGDHFVVPLPEAILLSSKVHESLRCDATGRVLMLATADAEGADFGHFLKFVHSGTTATLTPKLTLTFLIFCRLLGNDSLARVLLALLHPIGSSGLSWDDRSGCGDRPGDAVVRAIAFCDATIDYCASLFHLYSVKELQLLDRQLLLRILESPSLGIRTEDRLLQTLLDLGDDFAELLNSIYVEVPFLSSEGLSMFLDRLDFSMLTSTMWTRVSNINI